MAMLKRHWINLGILFLHFISSGQTTLFKNFYIADGTGTKLFLGDVRIRDNKIAILGQLIPQAGERVIDGQNRKILAPGFIDTHSHQDLNLEDSSQFSSFLNQGITTLVIGQDGSSHLPLQAYFEQLTQSGIPVNLASYTGHNTLRFKVLGNTNYNRAANNGEIRQMKKWLKQEMNSGALGLSTGLEYDPGIFSTKDEVMQLALTAARRDGRYASHLRSEDVGLEDALTEIIAIGQRTRMPVHISHFETAIHKMTGLSADHMGLSLRGKISPGFYVDLVIMDRDLIKDHASLEAPYELSSGIEQVWVNGIQVWGGRSFTGSRPGMVLKREAQ